MNALDEIFGSSEDAESGKGIVLNYGKAGKFVIHRAGGSNRAFGRLLEAKMRPYTRQIQNGTMDDDVARQLSADVYARTIVVGWEGVPGDDGGEREFSVENVVAVLTRYPDLFRDIQTAANDRSLFLSRVNEEVVGN